MKIPFTCLFTFRSLVFLAAALAAFPAHGDTDRYAGGNWVYVDSKKPLEAASAITLAKYPNCDEATVEEKIVQVYRADGTGENQDEAFVKVLTEKGKRNRRTLSLGFMLPYSTVEVVKIEVIKPTGEVVVVDVAANSKETIDHSQISMNIYDPNSKVLQVNIPGVEIGDVLHWVTRNTTLRPIIPGEFADGNVFEGDGYIRHMVYEVHAPLDKPLKKIVLRDGIPGTVQYTTKPGGNQTLVHRWEVTNVSRMFAELSMPPYENVLQRLLVSTTPDWHDISKWYWRLSKSHLEATTPELQKTVTDLTSNAKTDMDKIKALFYYVSQKIRYMGLTPEKGRPGYEPHDVCLTFGKKYGVCRDKAALLVSMLRTAGLNAYPVLVRVGSKKDHEVPDAGFNHAIVGVELKKGTYLLMDPTDEHARDLLPLHDCNQSYLVARPEGEDLQISAIKPPEENLMRIKTAGVLTAAGELEAKSELWFDGANDDVYRNEFSHMKPDDLSRYFEGCLKQAMPGATLKSLKLTPENMLDVSTGIKAEMEFSVDGMTATGHGKSVVSVPWIGNGVGLVNFILRGTGLDKRKYPLQTRVACGLDEEISLKLGDGFAGATSMPICAPVENDGMSYHQNFDVKNGNLECSRQLKLKLVEFAPAQYAKLKQTLKDVEYDARKSPVLAMVDHAVTTPETIAAPSPAPPVASDATILDCQKELEVTDPHTAIYRVKYSKRILTYAGKIREAEIKLNFNPACQEARFIRGVVTSKTGQRQEISKGEINIMDADWSASAKRYTGEKILVANLPGVDIGSTIEVEFEITMKDMPFVAGFEPFQLPDDLQQKSFQLTAPANVKIEKTVTGGGPLQAASSTDNSNRQVYRWNAEKIKARPAEQQLPPDWICTPGVAYFTGDFKIYLKELNDTLQDRSRSRAKAEGLARHIVSQSKSRVEAVKAIRDFVAKSIRLAGPSFTELPLKELSPADTTLADGYGHTADRAILLHAMLAAAGFQPEFIVASNLPAIENIQKVATSFPLPKSFDAPLVKLTLDGAIYYLNDTDQYAELGSTPHDGRLGITLSNQGYGVIKAAKDCQDRTETVYRLSFANDGKMQMNVSKHYFGGEYNRKNRYFSELRPEERKRYYQEIVSNIEQGARPVGDLTDQFDTYPGTEQFVVELDNYAVVDGNYLYFNLPFTPSLLQLPDGNNRSLPFMLSQESTKSVRTEIELPLGFQEMVIAPKSESLDAPAGSGKVRITSSATAGKFVLTDDFETSPAVINPQDYPAMLKVESALEKKSAKIFLLEKEQL
jgi:transglutaminase-like putative cysteine protease